MSTKSIFSGTLDKEWSFDKRNHLFNNCASYFLPKLLPGQKLFISYDSNPISNFLATEAANFLSRLGISIFISNKTLTPDMHKVIAKERFACGTLSFFNSGEAFPNCLLELADGLGKTIDISEISNPKITKLKSHLQSVDFYDPIFNLQNVLGRITNLDEEYLSSENRLVWNALYGPSSPLFEEIFSARMPDKELNAYTLNSQSLFVANALVTNNDFQFEFESAIDVAEQSYCNFAICSSSDLTNLKAYNLKSQSEFSSTEICIKILKNLLNSERIFISENSSIDVSQLSQKISVLDDNKLFEVLDSTDFDLIIDQDNNYYFDGCSFPTQFIVLFILLKDILFINSKEV